MNIAIITGGNSTERDISLSSAKNVQEILGIDDDFVFDYPREKGVLVEAQNDIDIVIPIIHGVGGEDGEVQIWLDKIDLPYIFSSPRAHKVAIDKIRAKDLVSERGDGVKVPQSNPKEVPAFYKPRSGGSSLDTGLITSQTEYDKFRKRDWGEDMIVEEAVKGREFTVGVIKSGGETIALPVVEIISPNAFFDYQSKYDPANLAREICPANISIDLENRLQKASIEIHDAIGCRHLSRSDFIVNNDNEIYFLETNTIPGMTKTSLVPKELEVAGIQIKELFLEWGEEVIKQVI